MGRNGGSLRAIDIFCGAGGFTLAAKQLKIKVIAAIEYNSHACETYRNNFVRYKRNRLRLYEQDVLSLEPEQILKDLELRPNELDILMGGPPCQGFSTHRIKNAGVGDARNELLERYFDFVRLLKPKVFIVENVAGLLWPRHKQHVERFYNLARRAGYSVHSPALLNAKDFGVPQNRKRVFILGHRGDLDLECNWPPQPTHLNPNNNNNGRPNWLPASVVFDMPLDESDPNNVHMQHSPELIEVFKSTPKNGGSRSQSNRKLACHKNHNGHRDVYGRIDPKKPGPTITTGCINPSKGRFLHPTENHGITVRHAARFQSFPDDFIFTGGLMATAAQVGNAVPIKLGTKVLTIISTAIERTHNDG